MLIDVLKTRGIKRKIISSKNYAGSRKFPLCNGADFSDGSIIWNSTGFWNTHAESVADKIREIFNSYYLLRFHKRDGIIYGNIVDYSHDKNYKLRNF